MQWPDWLNDPIRNDPMELAGGPIEAHPELLPIGGESAEEIKITDELTTICTQFFVIKINKGTNQDGKPTSQVGITSRIAFEGILPCVNDDGQICVILMSKTRPEGSAASWRGHGPVTKFPGGYFTKGSQARWGFVQDRLKALTGVVVNLNYSGVIGCIPGHTEIELPVIFTVHKRWEVAEKAAADICLVTLGKARELMQASIRRHSLIPGEPWCLENDTGVEIVAAIDNLVRKDSELFQLQPIPNELKHLLIT